VSTTRPTQQTKTVYSYLLFYLTIKIFTPTARAGAILNSIPCRRIASITQADKQRRTSQTYA
jgi:hypothetical protein